MLTNLALRQAWPLRCWWRRRTPMHIPRHSRRLTSEPRAITTGQHGEQRNRSSVSGTSPRPYSTSASRWTSGWWRHELQEHLHADVAGAQCDPRRRQAAAVAAPVPVVDSQARDECRSS